MTPARPDLDSPELRPCLEGVLPASLASASADGVPNVMWLSIVHRIDASHLGLSRQFFNKTSRNIEANKRLQLLVIHPLNGRQFQLNLEHERTEREGTHFDRVRVHLEGIASQSGMHRVFRLAGVDVCRVLSIDEVPAEGEPSVPSARRSVPLPMALRAFADELSAATDVDDLIARALEAIEQAFGFPHAMLLVLDETGERLYTVASRGYASSGVGSEVRLGEGHIGVAAARRQSILSQNLLKERAYAEAVRQRAARAGAEGDLTQEIPLPGLPETLSQLVVPILSLGRLIGALCLQSETAGFFRSEHEDVMNVAAGQLGMAMSLLGQLPTVDSNPWRIASPPAESPPAEVKHFASDDSILVDNAYLIKGVAGRILWRLLRDHVESDRVDFSNKEIRLDQSLALPELNDNLESRLILLRRRLEDRCPFIQIAKTGRGRFRLNVFRPVALVDQP